MTPRRRRSTRRSAANSRTRHSPRTVTLLIDECLGRHAVPEALKGLGLDVRLHSDIFPSGIDDAAWLSALASQSDVSVLSKDRQIRKRTIELEAVIAGRVRLFILTSAGLNSREQADAFVKAHKRILRFSQQSGPFIATVTASGKVRIAFDGRSAARRSRRIVRKK